MTRISEIQHSVAPEMAQLNHIIEQALHSDNAMMNAIVARYLDVKGKQLRPMLVLLSAKLLGTVNERVLNAGAAVELLHNASLIHDDVLDQSQLRRGRATINGVWDNHVAVLVGDFFVSNALACASRTGDYRVIGLMAGLGRDLSLGEVDQIDSARQRDLTEADYLRIIDKKTASLFTCCVEMGAIAGGAPDGRVEALKQWSRKLGLCFQIKDDTFDYFDDPRVGKPTGNDLLEGKITLPLIYALSLTNRPEHEAMHALARKPQLEPADITTLVEWAKECGGIDYAYDVMARLRDEAAAYLGAYGDNEVTRALADIFDFIIARDN